jgi:hypothetical protein
MRQGSGRHSISSDPLVVAAFCIATKKGASADWHMQPCDSFYLIEDGVTCAGLQSLKVRTGRNTLLLARKGEPRAYWNIFGETPRIWALYFRSHEDLSLQLPALAQSDPLRRVWKLSSSDADLFKTLFIRIAAENAARRKTSRLAASSWLKLIMVTVQRWDEERRAGHASSADSIRELVRPLEKGEQELWQANLLERSASCSCA